MKLSVVIPVYNEARNLPVLHRRLRVVLKKITPDYEIIFVNDGSVDDSLKVVKSIRRTDSKVKIINFSRNFGHMPAVSAGLSAAKGEKVVVMDADLQDPPKIIPRLYSASKSVDVVYAIKEKRKENAVRRFFFDSFYKLLTKLTPLQMPLNAGTFSLLDKKVVRIINSLPESNKYFSGLRAWAGFNSVGITYERGKRYSGKEASLRRLIKLALDGIVSFSHLPLRVASFLGILFATISFIFIAVVLLLRLFFGVGIVGWASTMSTILLIGGVQLITLGIIGEYLARIYDEVKRRPEYIISQKIGFGRD